MQFKPIAQNPLEWIAMKAGLIPLPIAYSHFGFIMSKVVLVAAEKNVFEVIGHGKISLDQLAQNTALNARALQSMLGVLASLGLIKYHRGMFSLTRQSKKWLLKDSPQSMYWLLMFDNHVCYQWMDYAGEFLATGKGLQYHDTFTESEWFFYQKAMAVSATATSREAVRKIPVGVNASRMLDIGGSHGLYAAEFCKKYPRITAEIFDLPEAIRLVEPAFNNHPLRDRITFTEGNILQNDIGQEKYDLVLMASLAHHLTHDQNMLVAQKVFHALKPGGNYCILEIIRNDKIKVDGDLLSSVAHFFFSLSSTSGAWSLREIKHWQQQAGFIHLKKSFFLTIPGYAAITAQKPY